jgi:hypothetical protein
MFYIAFILAQGIYQSYLWERSWERESEARAHFSQQVGGQQLISPDRHYRAVVPVIYRWPPDSSGKGDDVHWLCGSDATVALRIVPNDRPLAWRPHVCREETTYSLEPNEALMTWNCSVPVITWRSTDELLVQCNDCSTDNVQLAKPGFFSGKITGWGRTASSSFRRSYIHSLKVSTIWVPRPNVAPYATLEPARSEAEKVGIFT